MKWKSSFSLALILAYMTQPGCTQRVFNVAEPHEHSTVALMNAKGEMLPFNNAGDRIPDFSRVGYQFGEEDFYQKWKGLPHQVVSPSGSDNTSEIQTAIDTVSQWPLQPNGFRGVVFLSPGEYLTTDTLRINASGIILSGSSSSSTHILFDVQKRKHAIRVEGEGSYIEIAETRTPISKIYHPVGASILQMPEGHTFEPGDSIILEHAFNDKWIELLGMARISPNWQTQADGSRKNITKQWKARDYVYQYLRRITAVTPDSITLDIPLVQSLDPELGETTIFKYQSSGIIQKSAIQNIAITSRYDSEIQKENIYYVEPGIMDFVDEAHGDFAIFFNKIRHGWVLNVVAKHFYNGCVTISRDAANITVAASSSLDPVSRVSGGRRYSFFITGQLNLVKNCYASGGRHDFVLNSRVSGPNVFYNCHAENAFNGSEPHHRMAIGTLYDNVTVTGPGACLAVINRGNNGTGHGWMGTQTVFWNCASPIIVAQSPPWGENFIFGWDPEMDRGSKQFEKNLSRRLSLTNQKSGMNFTHDGSGVIGDAWKEGLEGAVYPTSLYLHQKSLKQNLR